MGDIDLLEELYKSLNIPFDRDIYTSWRGHPRVVNGKVYEIDLSHKGVTELPNNVFDSFTNLCILRLNNNNISSFPPGIFNDLKLKTLEIDANHYTTLPIGIFNHMPNLIELRIGSNEMTDLPDNFFQELDNLEYLVIKGNNFKIKENMFSNLKNLKTLGFTRINIDYFPSEIFNRLINLENLYLQGNHITDIPKGLLDNLNNLKILNLSKNQLIKLPKHILDNLSNLEVFDISYNKIKSLDSEIFKFNPRLRSINIENNRIKKLPELNLLSNLKDIKLANNLIQEIPLAYIFLPKIKYLNLRGNPENDFKKSINTVDYHFDLFKFWFERDPKNTFRECLDYLNSTKIVNSQIPWERILNFFSKKQLSHLRVAAKGEFEELISSYISSRIKH